MVASSSTFGSPLPPFMHPSAAVCVNERIPVPRIVAPKSAAKLDVGGRTRVHIDIRLLVTHQLVEFLPRYRAAVRPSRKDLCDYERRSLSDFMRDSEEESASTILVDMYRADTSSIEAAAHEPQNFLRSGGLRPGVAGLMESDVCHAGIAGCCGRCGAHQSRAQSHRSRLVYTIGAGQTTTSCYGNTGYHDTYCTSAVTHRQDTRLLAPFI